MNRIFEVFQKLNRNVLFYVGIKSNKIVHIYNKYDYLKSNQHIYIYIYMYIYRYRQIQIDIQIQIYIYIDIYTYT